MSLSSSLPLPAQDSKHFDSLQYPFKQLVFFLAQSDNSTSNGTTLWLGAQILTAFLANSLPAVLLIPPALPQHARVSHQQDGDNNAQPSLPSSQNIRRPRAIELGSGIGLTSLALAALGYDVLATDTSQVVDAVLRPNVQRNISANTNMRGSGLPGSVQVRVLDWTVPPEEWTWEDPRKIADAESVSLPQEGSEFELDPGEKTLGPPYDLIITSDTVYNAALTTPLLRTIHHFLALSSLPSSPTSTSTNGIATVKSKKLRNAHPPVYVALENRDPEQISAFFREAQDRWSMAAKKIPVSRVRKAMARNGLDGWKSEDWEDVEVWQMALKNSGQVVSQSPVEAPSCAE